MNVLIAWLLADFISGLVHWWEDRAITDASRWKFINDVRADNERHHRQPGYLVSYTWWENINTTAPIAWALAAVLYVTNCHIILWLTACFLGIGNLVHRWAHEPPSKLPLLVILLQRTGLFISGTHHSGHHFKKGRTVSREKSDTRFCVMSSWLNPMLDRIGFWRILERAKR